MKRYIVVLILVIPFLFASCGGDGVQIDGEFRGTYQDVLNEREIYLYLRTPTDEGTPIFLSKTTITNNMFSFANVEQYKMLKDINLPAVGVLATFDLQREKNPFIEGLELPTATFILEKGEISTLFTDTSVSLSGTPKNDDFNHLQEALTNIMLFYRNFDTNNITLDMLSEEEEINYSLQFMDLDNKLKKVTYDFTKDNIDNNVGQYLFLNAFEDNMYTPRQIKELIDLAPASFKALPAVNRQQRRLMQMEGQNLDDEIEELDMPENDNTFTLDEGL